jgi:hypothetical protein
MAEMLTLELPEDLARQARAMATASRRRLEDAVVDWIRRAVAEPDVTSLEDAQLLELCDGMMNAGQQDEMSDLLADNREGKLTAERRQRLDSLLDVYRRGTLLKARAWAEAVRRGIRQRLDQNGA